MIVGHLIIQPQNRLHHSIPRGRFTLFSHKNSCYTHVRFTSVVGVFPNFRHFSLFRLNFRHWNLKILAIWRHREFSSTNSELVNHALFDSGVKSMIRPGLSASNPNPNYSPWSRSGVGCSWPISPVTVLDFVSFRWITVPYFHFSIGHTKYDSFLNRVNFQLVISKPRFIKFLSCRDFFRIFGYSSLSPRPKTGFWHFFTISEVRIPDYRFQMRF